MPAVVCSRAISKMVIYNSIFLRRRRLFHAPNYKKNNAGSYLKNCLCECEPCRLFFMLALFSFINKAHVSRDRA